MAKPITNGAALAPFTFDDRLKLVQEEIQRRKQEANPTNPGAFVARLWVNWIKRNILNDDMQEVQQ